jgi:hypothetical protein
MHNFFQSYGRPNKDTNIIGSSLRFPGQYPSSTGYGFWFISFLLFLYFLFFHFSSSSSSSLCSFICSIYNHCFCSISFTSVLLSLYVSDLLSVVTISFIVALFIFLLLLDAMVEIKPWLVFYSLSVTVDKNNRVKILCSYVPRTKTCMRYKCTMIQCWTQEGLVGWRAVTSS